MGYTGNVIRGLSWTASIRVVIRILSFLKIVIIARVLSPTDLGLFSIATLVLAFVEIITETGVNVFLLQQKEAIDKYINTAWIVSIIRGIVISVSIALTAPLVSYFFKSPDSLPLLLLMSVVPFARGFINPSIITFQKELKFHKEFYFRTSLFFVETGISCFLVLVTRNVMGLIWGLIVSVFIEIIISFIMARPWPKLSFEKRYFNEVVSAGKWVTATGFLQYLFHNGDNIVVGRMLGTASLGLYDTVYRMAIAPITEVGEVVNKVTLPVFVKISSEPERLKKAFLRMLGTASIGIIPVGLVLFFLPEQIIKVVLGDAWLSASGALRILAVFGIVQALTDISTSFFYALKMQRTVSRIKLIGFLGLAVTIVPFILWWGLEGAAFSSLIGSALAGLSASYYFFSIRKKHS